MLPLPPLVLQASHVHEVVPEVVPIDEIARTDRLPEVDDGVVAVIVVAVVTDAACAGGAQWRARRRAQDGRYSSGTPWEHLRNIFEPRPVSVSIAKYVFSNT